MRTRGFPALFAPSLAYQGGAFEHAASRSPADLGSATVDLPAREGAALSGERPASLPRVSGHGGCHGRLGRPPGHRPRRVARQPALGALDRNAVTRERIPVQPECQQFIVQAEAVLGVRDATLTAEILQPVLGSCRTSPNRHRQARLARWRDMLPSPNARPCSQQNRSSASSGIIRRHIIRQAPGRDDDAIAVPG